MPILRDSIVLCAWLALVPSVTFAQTATLQKGAWSTDAASIVPPKGQEFVRVPSPDATRTVSVGADSIRITEGTLDSGKPFTGLESIAVDGPAELLWAPDSKAFAITSSDVGLGGTWLVSVFSLANNVVKILDVTSDVQEDFKLQYQCADNEKPDPSIGAITWMRGSSELLVIARIPSRESCGGKTTFAGYAIAVPSGEILSRFSESQLRDRWSRIMGSQLTAP